MAKTDFTLPRRIEQMYQGAIRRLIVPEIPKKQPDQTFEQWLAYIAGISERRDIADAAAFIAARMVRWVNVLNARSWREASAQAQRSRMLHGLLMREMKGPVGDRVLELVRENAKYITRIPREVSEHLTHDILRMQQAGSRPETIARLMRQRFPKMTASRIRLIARTESMKASASLTEARSEELKIPGYVWRTSRDSRVRPSHRHMDNVIVLYNDPPSPEALIGERSTLGKYHAGNAPNCRCPQLPLLTLDDVKWPHRVYRRGHIDYMSRMQFADFSGLRERRAA